MTTDTPNENIADWLIVLIILLVSANVVFYVISSQAEPTQNLYAQMWAYSESQTFKAMTTSLVIPIVMLFLENRLHIIKNFKDKIVEELAERERERKERIKKEKNDLIISRNEVLDKTRDFIAHVYSVISEIAGSEIVLVLPQTNGSLPNNMQTLSAVRNNLRSLDHMGNTVVGKLYDQFPSISNIGHQRIIFFLNVIQLLCVDIAFYLVNNKNSKEVESLKESLIMLQSAFQSLTFHSINILLEHHKRLLELTHGKVIWNRDDNLESFLPSNWKEIDPNMEQKDIDEIDKLITEINNEKQYLDGIKAKMTELLQSEEEYSLVPPSTSIEKYNYEYKKMINTCKEAKKTKLKQIDETKARLKELECSEPSEQNSIQKEHLNLKIKQLRDTEIKIKNFESFSTFEELFNSLSFEEQFQFTPNYSLQKIKRLASYVKFVMVKYNIERDDKA
jgi:hypothetical protein